MSEKKDPQQCTVLGRFIGGGLYQPKEQQNGGKKYSACVVLESTADVKKVEAAIEAAIDDKWNGKKPRGAVIWGVRTGDDPDFEHSFEQAFINPKSAEDKPPRVLRKIGGVSHDCEDVYPGCHVAVSVRAYAYDGDGKGIKPGVALGLGGVLFRKDGERIGGGFSESDFDGIESDDLDAEAFGEEAESLL